MGTTEIVESNNDVGLSGESLPELRQLCLQDLDRLTSIVVLNNYSGILKFKMLNHLKVCGCNELVDLLPLGVLKDLQQLKNIDISDCNKLVQVFKDEPDAQTTDSIVMEVLPLLHSFQLSNLPQLASICSRAVCVTSHSLTQMTVKNCPNFNFTFAYPFRRIEEQEPSQEKSNEMIVTPSRLENLDLHMVDHLEKMYKDLRVRFMRLTSLQLDECKNLEHLFSLSMGQELSSLRELKIISCDKIEQIVKRETEERASLDIVEFPQVKTLHLDKLPKFTGSSSSQDGYSVKWLALATVKVVDCPKIKKSMLGMVDRPLLNNVTLTNCPPLEHEDRESKISYLFDLTDELSKLKNLKIQDSKELKKYMEMDLQESSFTQLETVEAFQCDNELNKLFSFLLNKSRNLQQLTVGSCELLEQVFDLTDFVAEEQRNLKFPNLHTMQLLRLPKLNCIWNKDPRGIVEVGKLAKLEIIECGLRRSPLSTALLEKLVLLEKLKIESCKMIEQVVEDDVELQERSFPKLNDLQLVNLPKLVKFNSGHCNFRFPKLLSLRIEKCQELNVFTDGFLSKQKLSVEGTSDQGPRDEKRHACPELKTLKLADLKAVEVDSLRRLVNLESLDVINCSSLKGLVLPSICLEMKEIKISDCNNLQEIFTDPEKAKADKKSFHKLHSIVLEKLPVLSFFSLETSEFPSLKKLKIVNCPKLVTLPRNVSDQAHNLWNKVQHSELVLFRDIREDSAAEEGKMKIPPQLETLELSDLPKMQLWNQDPKIAVFEKLTSLKIIGCGSLEKLFSISVAERLSFLKWITLYKCEKMVQVLEGGGGKSKPVFQKLETLVLKHLPRLASFSEAEDVEFGEFPELKMVRVEHIPNMKTFVKKPLKTPKLEQVLLTHITKCWLGDLNETIKYLHLHHDTLKAEVWECDGSSTRHHTDTAESSSQASSRFREAAEMELHGGGMPRMES